MMWSALRTRQSFKLMLAVLLLIWRVAHPFRTTPKFRYATPRP